MPDAFELVDELPRTSVGKIDKRELRRQAAADPVTLKGASR